MKPRITIGLNQLQTGRLVFMIFWAHSDRNGLSEGAPGAQWQPLAEHLDNAARLSRQLAIEAAPEFRHFHDLAEWSGLLHDYGKYTSCFQEMIRSGKGKCPHAIYGAAMAWDLKAPHIAAAIAGHHAGMPDHGDLREKTDKNRDEAVRLLEEAAGDLPALGELLRSAPPMESVGGRFDLLTRMLLSCLVDADRLDSAARPSLQTPLDADRRLKVLLNYASGLAERSPVGVVRTARQEVLADCIAAAAHPSAILSLSVPTGGGKTLSAMALALKRAALQPDRYRRIIVVIPYLSIIEQNADVYSKVFGSDAILEHHSGSFVRLREAADGKHFLLSQDQDARDEAAHYVSPRERPETENWDAPLIVTTSVRFFESLFSNHPSDLRRVHNIAGSIVILDEVQVLPRSLLAPLLAMIDELARDWRCSFVLSTATTPAFEKPEHAGTKDRRWNGGTIHEAIRSPAELHRRLRRVTIDWRIHQPVGWPEVAEWVGAERQALCVVNTRDHAGALFDEISSRGADPDSLFHLSTRMCAAHRLQAIAAIRARLKDGLPCLVVSTQLIEAGVDLDFPVAFRALGPLDSIVQVAGRADREGLLTAELGKPAGRLVVFKPSDPKMPPNEYEEAAGKTETLAKMKNIQPDDLETMAEFFNAYYGDADLGTRFIEMRQKAQFRTLADEFEMISSRTQDVYVPFGDGKALIDELFARRRLDADLRRRLQRFTVGLQPWEFRSAKTAVLSELTDASNVWIAGDAAYDGTKGLQLSIGDWALFG